MHRRTGFIILLLFAVIVSMASAQSVESVASQKERCLRKLEKIERNLDNVAAGAMRLQRLRQASPDNSAATDAFIEKTQSKIEYMRNRIERARNLTEKIESDLQNVQTGSKCPKCIADDVNLFCRHVESLYTEHADLVSAMNEFERSLRTSALVGDLIKRTDRIIAGADSGSVKGTSRYNAVLACQEKARQALASNNLDAAVNYALEAGDSASALSIKSTGNCSLEAEIEQAARRIEEARRAVNGGAGRKAAAVLEKAISHLEKGKSLSAKGKSADARIELAIAEKFAKTAIDCATRKE